MIRRIVEIYRNSECFGKVEVVSNAIGWSATSMSESADAVLDLFSDDAFELVAEGHTEVADRGFTLIAVH